jgi:hypothetical protein
MFPGAFTDCEETRNITASTEVVDYIRYPDRSSSEGCYPSTERTERAEP